MDRLLFWLGTWLGRASLRVLSRFNDREQGNRLASVRSFFHESLPALDQRFVGKTIIEGGIYNYFELPGGDLPKFDFVLPEIPLYVYVGGVESASWEEARTRGVKRLDWDRAQADLDALQTYMQRMATIGQAVPPKILILRWGDSVNHHSLYRKLLETTDLAGAE